MWSRGSRAKSLITMRAHPAPGVRSLGTPSLVLEMSSGVGRGDLRRGFENFSNPSGRSGSAEASGAGLVRVAGQLGQMCCGSW